MRLALTWMLACATATAQAGRGVLADFAALQARLQSVPRPTPKECGTLIREFLAAHAADGDQRELLQAWLWLGAAQLRAFDGASARASFTLVAERARGGGAGLRAQALYGLHQAQRLLGDDEQAKASLRDIIVEAESKAAVASAHVALKRMQEPQRVAIGARIPELQARNDVQGRPVPKAQELASARLLVFWTHDHEPSQRRLEQLARAWEQGGMRTDAIVAYALDDDPAQLRRLADQRQWQFPVIAGDKGFLHPDWLALDVTAVPTVLLLGRDGTLLARDLGADRLRELLDKAR